MKLYDFELSGNCYKVRLFLSLLKAQGGTLNCKSQAVALGSENHTPEFRALHPLGQVPVLEDEGLVLWDSQAILVHLARRYSPQWLPEEWLAPITAWLSLAANEIANGPARLRRIHLFGRQEDEGSGRELCTRVFQVLEQKLSQSDWLVGASPTIADLACYPYLALAPEGNFATDPYPAVQAWMRRIEGLEGYIPLPGAGRK